MKVIRLTAENVKRLRAVEITPDGNVVVIAGRNAQGKTSVLDSIWLALGGGAASKDTAKPIRDGEDNASVFLDLGDFTVKRTWAGDKTALTVMSKEGAKYPSPQKFLDEKLGALSFDPLAFAQQDNRSQLATLLALVELPFNPDELAAARRATYDERTTWGRDLANAKAQLASIPQVPDDTPDQEVSSGEILAEQAEHQRRVHAAEASQRDLIVAEENAKKSGEEVRQAEVELRRLREHLVSDGDALENAKNAVVAAPEAIDFTERLTSVEQTNRNVRTMQDRLVLTGAVEKFNEGVEKLTADIVAIDKSKAKALAEAKMPVEGLAFDDDGVTYNGVPFKQCSSSEQLRISLAMAMSLNPEIRVVRISDGSLLDSENMAVIAEMADAHDFQCWIERVDESGEIGFVIEDGAVAND
ncbi:MAG TPA: AAA family ATPase [Acidimicrobiales bacterium]|nr:AAA family ATPase [Acidimicrobiales bacterium]